MACDCAPQRFPTQALVLAASGRIPRGHLQNHVSESLDDPSQKEDGLLTENPGLEATFHDHLQVREHRLACILARLGDFFRDTQLTQRLPLVRTGQSPVDEAIPEMLNLRLDACIGQIVSGEKTPRDRLSILSRVH